VTNGFFTMRASVFAQPLYFAGHSQRNVLPATDKTHPFNPANQTTHNPSFSARIVAAQSPMGAPKTGLTSPETVANLRQRNQIYFAELKQQEKIIPQNLVFAALSQRAKDMWQLLIKRTQSGAKKQAAALARAEVDLANNQLAAASPQQLNHQPLDFHA
jgi:hypothetical protein